MKFYVKRHLYQLSARLRAFCANYLKHLNNDGVDVWIFISDKENIVGEVTSHKTHRSFLKRFQPFPLWCGAKIWPQWWFSQVLRVMFFCPGIVKISKLTKSWSYKIMCQRMEKNRSRRTWRRSFHCLVLRKFGLAAHQIWMYVNFCCPAWLKNSVKQHLHSIGVAEFQRRRNQQELISVFPESVQICWSKVWFFFIILLGNPIG